MDLIDVSTIWNKHSNVSSRYIFQKLSKMYYLPKCFQENVAHLSESFPTKNKHCSSVNPTKWSVCSFWLQLQWSKMAKHQHFQTAGHTRVDMSHAWWPEKKFSKVLQTLKLEPFPRTFPQAKLQISFFGWCERSREWKFMICFVNIMTDFSKSLAVIFLTWLPPSPLQYTSVTIKISKPRNHVVTVTAVVVESVFSAMLIHGAVAPQMAPACHSLSCHGAMKWKRLRTQANDGVLVARKRKGWKWWDQGSLRINVMVDWKTDLLVDLKQLNSMQCTSVVFIFKPPKWFHVLLDVDSMSISHQDATLPASMPRHRQTSRGTTVSLVALLARRRSRYQLSASGKVANQDWGG